MHASEFNLSKVQVQKIMKLLTMTDTKRATKDQSSLAFTNMAGSLFNSQIAKCFSNESMSKILDTRATHQITNNIDVLLHCQRIKNFFVQLPNSTRVSANHALEVRLAHDFVLKEVLYVPSFSFNLISISKLTETRHLSVTFPKHDCLIQDRLEDDWNC